MSMTQKSRRQDYGEIDKKEVKRFVSALMSMVFFFVTLTSAGVYVAAGEGIPEGAYDPQTYVPITYTVPSVDSSEKETEEYKKFTEFINEHWFRKGDKIIFSDTDDSGRENGYHIYCYTFSSLANSGHSFQALEDMGIIRVDKSAPKSDEYGATDIIKSIEFVDETKLVKLRQGNGHSASGGHNGFPYYYMVSSVEADKIVASSLAVRYEYYDMRNYNGVDGAVRIADNDLIWKDGTKDTVVSKIYPVFKEENSITYETAIPAVKGLEPYGADIPYYPVTNTIGSDKGTLKFDDVIYSKNIETTIPLMPEDYDDYFVNRMSLTLKQQADGTYKFPVLDQFTIKVNYKQSDITYTVRFETNGGSEVEVQTVAANDTVGKPGNPPARSGYTFEGWYSDPALTKAFDFADPIREDTIIYAKWAKVSAAGNDTAAAATNPDGSQMQKNSDGSTTTTSPDGKTVTTVSSDGKKTTVTETNGTKTTVTGTSRNAKGTVTEVVVTMKANGNTLDTKTYKISGKSAILKSCKTAGKSVTIPASVASKVNGKTMTYKVTVIAKNAFKNNKKITSVSIGKNIKKIEANAFRNCKKLKNIVISGKLSKVSGNAFKGIRKNASVRIKKKYYQKTVKLLRKSGIKNVRFKKLK